MKKLDYAKINTIVTTFNNKVSKVLDFTYSNSYQSKRMIISFDPVHIAKSLKDLQNSIRKRLPSITNSGHQIEECIIDKLDRNSDLIEENIRYFGVAHRLD